MYMYMYWFTCTCIPSCVGTVFYEYYVCDSSILYALYNFHINFSYKCFVKISL